MSNTLKIKIEKNEKQLIIFILFSALIFYSSFIIRSSFYVNNIRFFTLIEDAMISMRYAKHLANGFGLVWNIGEQPIQGFTNLGWTVYMAALHKLPVPESKISLLVMITGGFILIGVACSSYILCKKIDPNSVAAPMIVLLVTGFYYPLVFWSLRGMEVGLLTLLILVLANLVIRPSKPLGFNKSWFIGIIIFVTILVRFDSIFQVFLIVLFVFYGTFDWIKGNLFPKSLILIFFILSILSVLLFQLTYFGSLLPNTYYLKVEGVSLAQRVNVGFQAFVEYASRDIFTLFFIALAGLIFFQDLRKKETWFLLAMFLVQIAYSIYVGGDYAEPVNGGWYVDGANRFITQGMPFLFVVYGVVVERIIQRILLATAKQPLVGSRKTMQAAILVGLITLVIISMKPWFKWSIYNAPGLSSDIRLTKVGLAIRENTDERAIIAVHGAGQIPYYSGRKTIDLLGKSDPVIAHGTPAREFFMPGHNKWNYEYSITNFLPDLIADEEVL
ncbi:MAG: hypothetical protein JSV73_12090, partial [Flavobacteriaceae bacterium]